MGTPVSLNILFGNANVMPSVIRTDHPFFPPVESENADAKWMSVVENLKSIDTAPGWSVAQKEGVRGGNAIKLFGI